jgi:catechol 2,3-dioxygenase-like lactoylglutathione lyase family enzyme
MAADHPMLVGAATVFVVSDIAKSIAYYRDALGFQVTFQ